MSQQQLGGEEFSPSYVSAVERGKIRPSLKALYILADRLGEPVTRFLHDEQDSASADGPARLLIAAAIDVHQGRAADAVARLRGVALGEARPEHALQVHMSLGQALLASHQPSDAVIALQEALHLADVAGDAALAACARLYLGKAFLMLHKPGQALDYHRRCLQSVLDGVIKDAGLALQVYSSLAEDLAALGRAQDAVAYRDAALALANSAATLPALAANLWDRSTEAAQQGRAEEAHTFAQRGLATYDALDAIAASAHAANAYAGALRAAGDLAGAERLYSEARATAERIEHAGEAATATIRLGEMAGEHGDHTRAEALISQGIEQARSAHDDAVAGAGLLALAQVHVAQSNRSQAESCFRAAIELVSKTGASSVLSKVYFSFGQALVAWGESVQGSEFLAKAYLESHEQ
jgi:tetratricopeptide (TPR) repeat protein